jgi:hypothetical protein
MGAVGEKMPCEPGAAVREKIWATREEPAGRRRYKRTAAARLCSEGSRFAAEDSDDLELNRYHDQDAD